MERKTRGERAERTFSTLVRELPVVLRSQFFKAEEYYAISGSFMIGYCEVAALNELSPTS
ncbi:hypothetical protein [Candidatus Tisiphia endosymbiont of Sialis lutaria]|uniref:hypothetical protein n=1 Tax=Candidatus Tisiphia endosymbiont of Sialis lutaria TaxID=2029164 RepID=UPI00312CAE07